MKSVNILVRFAYVMSLAFAGAASASIIGSNNTVHDINDFSVVTSTITIANHGNIGALGVTVAVEHTFVHDLIYTLSKEGTTVTLMNRPDSTSFLSELHPLSFSDTSSAPAAATIGAGACNDPLIDTTLGITAACLNTEFRSEESLAAFSGIDMFGDWTLTISDNGDIDIGRLSNWSLSDTPRGTVPEPGSLALLGLALAGMGAARRKNRR